MITTHHLTMSSCALRCRVLRLFLWPLPLARKALLLSPISSKSAREGSRAQKEIAQRIDCEQEIGRSPSRAAPTRTDSTHVRGCLRDGRSPCLYVLDYRPSSDFVDGTRFL